MLNSTNSKYALCIFAALYAFTLTFAQAPQEQEYRTPAKSELYDAQDIFSNITRVNDSRHVCLHESNSGNIQMVEVNAEDTCTAPASVIEEANKECPGLSKFLKETTIDVDSGVSFDTRNFAVNLDWEFRLRPSFRSEAFLRTDIWTPTVSLRAPWDIYSFSIARQGRFVYTTNYPNACDAANPMNAKTPFDTPNTAEKAMLKMRVNDYVRIDMETNFAFRARDFADLFSLGATPMGIHMDAYYVLSGGFQVHVNKLDNKRVRLWIVTDPAETIGAEIAFGVQTAPNLVGVNILDKAITRVFKLNELLSWGIEAQNSIITLFDTTLDLSDAEAADAYNQALNGFLQLDLPNAGEFLKSIPQVIADKSMLAMADHLYTLPVNNLGPLFEIAKNNARMDNCRVGTGDGTIEPCVPTSIVLNNDITNRASTNRVQWKVGLSEVLAKEDSTIYRTNRVTKTEYGRGQEDFVRKYMIPTWQQNEKMEDAIFGTGYQRVIRQANAIFLADNSWSPARFLTMAFSYSERDTNFSQDEMKRLARKIERLIPNEYEQLKFILQENGWFAFPKGHKDGVEVHFKYTFKEQGYMKLFGDSRFSRSKSLEQIIFAYFKGLQDAGLLPYSRSAQFYANKIKTLAKKMADVFDPNVSSKERYDRFAKLRESSMFVDYGPGILIHLATLDGGTYDTLMSFKLALYGRKELPVEFLFGEDENQELAEVVAFTEDILNRLDNDGVVVFGETESKR